MTFTRCLAVLALAGMAGMYGCGDDSSPTTPGGGTPVGSGDSTITVADQPLRQSELRGDSVLVVLTDDAGVAVDTVQVQRLTILTDTGSAGSVSLGTVEANEANLATRGAGAVRIDTIVAHTANIEVGHSGAFSATKVRVDTLNLTLGGSGAIEIDSVDATLINISSSELSQGSLSLGRVRADTIVIDLSGNGGVYIDSLEASAIIVRMDGTGSCRIAGEAVSQQLTILATGSYQAVGLRTDTTILSYGGAGTVTVWVERSFVVEHNGSGFVYYRGDATVSGGGADKVSRLTAS